MALMGLWYPYMMVPIDSSSSSTAFFGRGNRWRLQDGFELVPSFLSLFCDFGVRLRLQGILVAYSPPAVVCSVPRSN